MSISTARRVASFLALTGLLSLRCALALDPALDVSQYGHTSWKIRDGFAGDVVTSFAQTPDGYLWLGTVSGLMHFDGVRIVRWQPPAGTSLPDSRIRALVSARDGTLWIGTFAGLASWKQGKLITYPAFHRMPINSLVEDREGTVWATAKFSPGLLCAVRLGRAECQGEDGRFGAWTGSLFEDSNGALWMTVPTGVWRWKPGPPVFHSMPEPVGSSLQVLAEAKPGVMLVVAGKRIWKIADDAVEEFPVPGLLESGTTSRTLFRDRDDAIWIGSYQGVRHVRDGRSDAYARLDGLSSDVVERLFEDREGNVWVATEDGVDRFRVLAAATYSVAQGISGVTVAVLADRDGNIWISTTDGLYRWQEGHATRVVANAVFGSGTGSLFQDHQGRIWIGSHDVTGYLDGDHIVAVSGVPKGFVDAIDEDSEGNLWMAHRDAGLLRLSPKLEVQQVPWREIGQSGPANSVAIDFVHGGLWLGFRSGGTAHLVDGRVRASYSTADGLGKGSITHVRVDADGTVWAATEGGLSRIKAGRIVTLDSRGGLPCDRVHWTTQDDDGASWLYTQCGLVHIARSDLESWATATELARAPPRIRLTVMDNSDGVRAAAILASWSPKAAQSRDGKLWLSTQDGVSMVDPRHLPFNELPPPVHVEQIIADRKTYEPPSRLQLPPLLRDLQIDYTALSLVAPEKNQFRYKLEGRDSGWQDAGNRRQAFYTDLDPGDYRFRVIAANNSGVWNEEGASLDFSIAPAYWQTNWFRALCVLTFFALLWGAYRMRIRRLQEHEKKFRDAIETMPALAFIAGPKGNRTFMNRGWLEYAGLSAEESSASGWEKTIHPDDLKRFAGRWRTSETTGQPLDHEARLRRGSDGVFRWFLIRAVPVRDKRGNIVKWCGVATDIEDRKRAEQLQADLTHASRVSTMGEMVASISHELAQPITVTIAHAKASLRWLERDPPEVTQARKGTEKIVEAGALASEIINRLRSLYKNAPPKREWVAMNEVVGGMAEMMRGEATEHGVSIRTDLKDDLPMTVADRVQLQQVLMNLMLNGIEAMKDTGGVLTVKSQLREDGQIQVSVHDTGPGLPPGKAEQIFDAFFTTKPQGSGMGLAICKSIIESQGGRIWANGNGGRGATFHFTLAAASAETIPPLGAA